ncbi:Peptidase M19, renal dipeptidase, partial [mine drainage metagenome]
MLTKRDLTPGPGTVGGLLAIEGMHCLGDSVELIEILHHLGVRSGMLTWNDRNALADGAMSQEAKGGLSAAGKRFVQRMQELHWLIDCSHLGDSAFWSLLEATEGPVIASHSNARAVRDHVRNLTDEQIRALAERGGMLGMNFASAFIVDG